ncbi:MAG: AcrB/AcrD/AcrF family protein [Chitinivibrionales bacterium]|nr:AcrB/AcrD/AcrF family protein [Chitinivibrionales bacterium]MBD3397286.1 AcrB/AcrD/AcrF family protein [Chitinivibrionales bacterium]
MKGIIRHFIVYPVWANTLMIAVVLAGVVFMGRIKRSFFPEVETNLIIVNFVYPGTSPEEIEESLILKAENNLKGIAGIDRTTSQSSENSGSVTVEVMDNYDVDEVYDDVKNAIDRITPYPAGAEKPVIRVPKIRTRAVTVALYGNADLWALKERAEQFRDDLLAIDGISQVSLEGIPGREIAITVSEDDLRRYGLTFNEIGAAIRGANVDISGGSIKTHDERLLIRAYGRRDFAHEIQSLVLRTAPDGTVIRIGDVARVREQWEDTPDATYLNGKRAVMVNVDKTIEEDIVRVAREVTSYVGEFAAKHPEISIEVIADRSEHLKERINLLARNGLFGFVLVVLVLGMFLNSRLSFWVAVGIPISFAGMFVVAYLWGITINVISLMGMIIVVGILVDDAIVVAESIYQKHEEGLPPMRAAIDGLFEVIAPVFTAVSTTIIAFLPFFFFLGTMGKVIYQLAVVVISALAFSLIESIFILPAHLAHSKGLDPATRPLPFRAFFDRAYVFLRERVYGPALSWALRNITIVLVIPVAYVLVTLGLLRGNIVEVSAFPYIDRDDIRLNLTMTTGTREEVTDSILQAFEEKVWKVNEELSAGRRDKRDVILSVTRHIGSNGLGDNGGHAGSLEIEMLEGSLRDIPSFRVQNRIRQTLGVVPGSQKLSFAGGRWGKAISISLISNDLAELDKAKDLLKAELAQYSALSDITDSDIEGWREVRLSLLPAAYAAGLTLQDVAGQVRQGFFGYEVQRYQRGEDQLKVWVRFTEEDRASLGKLENMYIRAPDGSAYPLASIAGYDIERGRVRIAHLEGKRELQVEADLRDPEQSVTTILNDIRKNAVPRVLARVKNVYVSYEGRERHNVKFARSLWGSFPIALMTIAIILVLVFHSPLQAVIIFLMIPLGLLGAIWGHLFHGFMISRLSMFGLVALAGIVINDSIVFIDQINRNLKKHLAVRDAVYLAGLSRLRPIILTTVTTVAGMAPLLLEQSRQAKFLVPMAVSLCYGLIFGSLFILFIVPALFMALNRVRVFAARRLDPSAAREAVEPAVKELTAEQEANRE